METVTVSKQTVSKSNVGTYILLIATTTFWGSAFVTSKISVGVVPPTVAAFIRFGLGAIFAILLLLLLHSRDKTVRLIPKGSWFGIIILGFIGVAVYNLLFFWGLAFSRASDGSMIIPTLSPAITVILAALFLKERFGRQQITGLGLTLIGSAVFFSAIGFTGIVNTSRIIGDLLFLAAAACWSAYTLLGKKVLQKVSPLLATAYAMFFGSIILGVVSVRDFGEIQWSSLGLGFWLNQFYLALFPSVLANWFYYLGIKRIGASRASVFMYFVPVSGLILSGLILDDVLTFLQFVGSAIMIFGLWVINKHHPSKKNLRMLSNNSKNIP